MKCSGCGGSMGQRNYEGVVIDQCTQCGGIWLDHGEVQSIIKAVDEGFSDQQQEQAVALKGVDHKEGGKTGQCPKCNAPLETFQYMYDSGVYVDRCPNKHGIYFDPGELEKVQILYEMDLIQKGKHPSQLAPKPSSSGQRRCPRDGSPLSEIKYETELVDLCKKCGGIWCDEEELLEIVKTRQVVTEGSLAPDTTKGQHSGEATNALGWLKCVVCQAPLTRVNYGADSSVMIDRCAKGHGVWLDHGEIEAVQAYVEGWEDEEGNVRQKLAGALEAARAEASEQFDKAVKDGRESAYKRTMLGKLLKKLG